MVVDAVEGALVELAVGTPDIVAVGDGFAFVVGGDDRLGVAIIEGFVGDDPAVPVTLFNEAEGFEIVVVVDPWLVVDGDEGVAAEGVVGVGGFLE